MAKKSGSGPPPDKLELYERLVATCPNVETKGATMPYTSLNGHMFSFLTEDGTLALRLSSEDREAFLKRYRTRLCERHGRVMQEFVEVPDSLLKKTRALKPYFDQSLACVSSLKPKPSKRKKQASGKAAARKK